LGSNTDSKRRDHHDRGDRFSHGSIPKILPKLTTYCAIESESFQRIAGGSMLFEKTLCPDDNTTGDRGATRLSIVRTA
jgi:hypothetical protein